MKPKSWSGAFIMINQYAPKISGQYLKWMWRYFLQKLTPDFPRMKSSAMKKAGKFDLKFV